jgi:hypothetical protein
MRTCRRQIRCALCTPYRWRGNAAARFKAKEQARRKALAREIKNAR